MSRKIARIAIAVFILSSIGLAGCATTGTPSKAHEERIQRPRQQVKAAFGVRKPKHVGVALMTGQKMLAGDAEQNASDIAIVACGPAIRSLATGSKLEPRIRSALENGIRLKACGVTVRRMGFDPSRFIDGVHVVPNGFVELIRLQQQGYHTIEL